MIKGVKFTPLQVFQANPWLTTDKKNVDFKYHTAIVKYLTSQRLANKRVKIETYSSQKPVDDIEWLKSIKYDHVFPTVGTPATMLSGSDRYACIVSVSNPNSLIVGVKYMSPKFIGSGYGDERYEYKDKDGNWLVDDQSPVNYYQFKNGFWYERDENGKTRKPSSGFGIVFGCAHEYKDPSF